MCVYECACACTCVFVCLGVRALLWLLSKYSFLVRSPLSRLATWDAPDVTGYEEPFQVTPSELTVNILQDDAIEYTNFHFYITICSKIKSFQRPLPFPILPLKNGGLKT